MAGLFVSELAAVQPEKRSISLAEARVGSIWDFCLFLSCLSNVRLASGHFLCYTENRKLLEGEASGMRAAERIQMDAAACTSLHAVPSCGKYNDG